MGNGKIKSVAEVMDAEFVDDINELCAAITLWASEKGFWDDQYAGSDELTLHPLAVSNKLALIHSEVSEALEADRKGIKEDDKVPEYTGLEAELADAVIRIFDLAGALGLRLGESIRDKMAYNEGRPYKHGKAY